MKILSYTFALLGVVSLALLIAGKQSYNPYTVFGRSIYSLAFLCILLFLFAILAKLFDEKKA